MSFRRQLIGRHILQEHDQAETGRLLGCAERTVRTYAPIALDLLSRDFVRCRIVGEVIELGKILSRGFEIQFLVSAWKMAKINFKNLPVALAICYSEYRE